MLGRWFQTPRRLALLFVAVMLIPAVALGLLTLQLLEWTDDSSRSNDFYLQEARRWTGERDETAQDTKPLSCFCSYANMKPALV